MKVKKEKLEGEEIYISHDRTRKERENERILRTWLKSREQEEKDIAKVRHNKVIIGETIWMLEEDEGRMKVFIPKKRRWRDRRKEKRKSTDIIFWNVAGAAKLSNKTWEELRKCEIIGLTETWLEAKNEKILERQLKDDNWETIVAKRIKKRERAKGGMLLAIRKEIETVGQER